MATIVAIANRKGGVGKTLTSRSFSTCLAHKGFKVLAVDGDPQGDLTRQFGIMPSALSGKLTLASLMQAEIANRTNMDDGEDFDDHPSYEYSTEDAIITTSDNVDLLPSVEDKLTPVKNRLAEALGREYVLKTILTQVEDSYDYIIIDCPPDVGLLTINLLAAADKVIMPAFTEESSLTAIVKMSKVIKMVEKNNNPNLEVDGILFTKVQKHTRVAKTYMQATKESFPFYLYDAYIPMGISAAESAALHESIFSFDKNGAVAKAYEDFTEEFLKKEQNES